MQILQTLLAFVVALGILVTIHEFGHFWVARRVGVKILRFSVGFGKPLWVTRRGPDQTEFAIAAIPLGGYVKMLDEREGEVPDALKHRAFTQQTLGNRVAIVAAGPLANFIFAIVAYWAMYLVGVSGPSPIIGEVTDDSLAAHAGLVAGEQIVSVNGNPAPTWDNVFRSSVSAILDAGSIELGVRNADGITRVTSLNLQSISVDDLSRGDFFESVGFVPFQQPIPAVIGKVIPDEPADRAGLIAGDRIISANGTPIEDWVGWVKLVRASPEQILNVVIVRADQTRELVLTPKSMSDNGETIGRIGAEVDVDGIKRPPSGIERYGAADAVGQAFRRTGEITVTTLKFLRKMVIGEASVENLSGPISIAHYAGQSAQLGLSRFLDFLGLVSISLGILNLLPIPLLDGGHLLYYLLEFAMRRPVPESVQVVGQQIGLVMLLSLMGLAVYNDIMRLM